VVVVMMMMSGALLCSRSHLGSNARCCTAAVASADESVDEAPVELLPHGPHGHPAEEAGAHRALRPSVRTPHDHVANAGQRPRIHRVNVPVACSAVAAGHASHVCTAGLGRRVHCFRGASARRGTRYVTSFSRVALTLLVLVAHLASVCVQYAQFAIISALPVLFLGLFAALCQSSSTSGGIVLLRRLSLFFTSVTIIPAAFMLFGAFAPELDVDVLRAYT
jgi:hypothetical protein